MSGSKNAEAVAADAEKAGDAADAPWHGRAAQIDHDRESQPISSGQKKWQLLRLMATNPVEFHDRMRAILEMKAQKRWPTKIRYTPEPWETLVEKIAGKLNPEIPWTNDEPGFLQTCRDLEDRLKKLGDNIPFPASFDGDMVLSRLCYFLTLTLKPTLVVDSGVALGVTSSFILAAMERNGHGRLVSVDLPPLCVTMDMTGALVPDSLRHRWTLHRGSSVRVLPKVLPGLPPVDMFIHDSLFTSRNSRQEYETVLPHLSNRSAIISNRINPTDAFGWLRDTSKPQISSCVSAKSKDELIGFSLYLKGGK